MTVPSSTPDAATASDKTAPPRDAVGGSLLRRGLTIAVFEGAIVGGMFAGTENWLAPLLKFPLGHPAFAIGLLTSVPLAAMALVGIAAGPVIRWLGGNKPALLLCCWIQIACLLALSLVLNFADQPWAPAAGLSLAIGIGVVGAFGSPAWLSWMGDLIPRQIRGRYFSQRYRVLIATKLVFAAAFALVMSLWPAQLSVEGLQLVMATAAFCRLLSTLLLTRQPEVPPRALRSMNAESALHHKGGLWQFVRTMPRTDLGRWTMVWATLHFGLSVSGPYFVVYMLDPPPLGLGLAGEGSAWAYYALINTATVTRLLVLPAIGRLVDRYGAGPMLRLSVLGITVIPLVWASTPKLGWLLAIEVLSGLSWCTAECAVNVLLFSCAHDPVRRTRLIGYHQSVTCAVIVVGITLGGWLHDYDILPPLFGSTWHSLFLLSLALRVPAVILALILLPRLVVGQSGLWRLIPGVQSTITIGRGVMSFLRRPDD